MITRVLERRSKRVRTAPLFANPRVARIAAIRRSIGGRDGALAASSNCRFGAEASNRAFVTLPVTV
jgi:hypothetical protein